MKFRKISINGVLYGNKEDMEGVDMEGVDFRDSSLFLDMEENNDKQGRIMQAMLIMSTCHNLSCEVLNDNIKYVGTSPDEIVMLNFTRLFGFLFQGKTQDTLYLHF